MSGPPVLKKHGFSTSTSPPPLQFIATAAHRSRPTLRIRPHEGDAKSTMPSCRLTTRLTCGGGHGELRTPRTVTGPRRQVQRLLRRPACHHKGRCDRTPRTGTPAPHRPWGTCPPTTNRRSRILRIRLDLKQPWCQMSDLCGNYWETFASVTPLVSLSATMVSSLPSPFRSPTARSAGP